MSQMACERCGQEPASHQFGVMEEAREYSFPGREPVYRVRKISVCPGCRDELKRAERLKYEAWREKWG